MVKFVTVVEMQAIERQADAGGLSYEQMMENAGLGLAEQIMLHYDGAVPRTALALVGSGNNGGDALVALIYLAKQGWKVGAFLVRERPRDDLLIARLVQVGGATYLMHDDHSFVKLKRKLHDADVLVDGILGTGFRLPLRDDIARVLNGAGQLLGDLPHKPFVVAVDCPSGVDCDTGMVSQGVIQADMTVAMAAVKAGLFVFPAADFVGKLQVVGIGNLEDVPAWQNIHREVVDAADVRAWLPVRPNDAHKGTFGTAMVVAGSLNYPGAARLAGEAAYRVGAGLVAMAVPEPLYPVLAGHLPEATWLVLPSSEGVIAAGAARVLMENLRRVSALLIGPGFGLKPQTLAFLDALFLQRYGAEGGAPPLVFDADGLKLLAQMPDWSHRLWDMAVLTPHPGEMAVLTGLGRDEIQQDRIRVAEHFARQWGHVVVLKGAYTVIASPDGSTAVIPVATPALARAGTGDVLAGLIVGLRAQGLDAFSAARCGAWIHAQAGLCAAKQVGNSASVLARDVLGAVGEVINSL